MKNIKKIYEQVIESLLLEDARDMLYKKFGTSDEIKSDIDFFWNVARHRDNKESCDVNYWANSDKTYEDFKLYLQNFKDKISDKKSITDPQKYYELMDKNKYFSYDNIPKAVLDQLKYKDLKQKMLNKYKDEYENCINILELNKQFLICIKMNDLEKAKEYIEKGANINAEDNFALIYAISNEQLEVVKFLVENGADIHADDDYALRHAAERVQLEIIKFLVEKGADIHARDDEALKYAAFYGHLEIVKYLVEKGTDVYVDNNDALRNAII